MQESVEDIQKRSEISLLQSEESFSSQLRLLEQAKDKLEAKSSRMKEELNSTRRQEAHLRALVAELGYIVTCMYVCTVFLLKVQHKIKCTQALPNY